MPFDPTLDELSSEQQRQMTHQATPPTQRYDVPVGDIARKTFIDPLQAIGVLPGGRNWGRDVVTGIEDFSKSGLSGVDPSLREYMPGWFSTLGDLAQSQAARNVFSTANIGGMPLIEAMWTPRDLGILKIMYSADIDPYTLAGLIKKYLPGRSPVSIRQKAFQLGLKRPEIPPYVRQPGSPSVANDPERAAQIAELLKKGMSSSEISSRMGDVSARTVRRYINENLNRPRMGGRGGSANPPSMPSFQSAIGPTMGDKEFEKILQDFLEKNPEYR